MTETIKYVQIKYKPTGVVFNLPEKDAIETLESDRGNFEALDKDFKLPEAPKNVETTTFKKVVEDENDNDGDGSNEDEEKPDRETQLNSMKVAQLVAYCEEKQIAYDKKDKKPDLIRRIIEAEATAETTTETNVVEDEQN